MSKSHTYLLFNCIRIDLFFSVFLVLIISLSTFSDFILSSDIEIEKIENLADGENESKEQEKLDKSEKDVFFAFANNDIKSAKIKALYENLDHSKFYTYYLKNPTPPPDHI